MSDPEKPTAAAHPESPTAARELDFDDDTQALPAAHTPATLASAAPPTNATEDIPPPKPPRPLSPQQQAENTLKEAFPSIDAVVVRAVLTASGGQIEPAFNALLGMTDPDSQKEPAPPPQPARPAQVPIAPTSTAQSQVEADEQYARQLAEHYSGSSPYGGQSRSHSGPRRDPAIPRPQRDTGLKPNELYDDRDHSFLDDDLPVIKDSIRKGFFETQSKVNSWVMNLKKRIDGEDTEEFQTRPPLPGTHYPSNSPTQPYGSGSVRRSGDLGRRSADRDRYDADPQVLGDDFTSLQLRDEEVPPPRPTRPLANPNLFNPTPSTPSTSGRRVSFVEGPPEEIDSLYRASPPPSANSSKRTPPSSAGGPAGSGRQSKWQPLSAVDPSPVADHDPFSLGDSDDEGGKRDARGEGKEAQAVRVGAGTGAGAGSEELRPAERTGGAGAGAGAAAGVRDKEAEELLTK